ncbi:MAG: DUF4136 domain-containing protein [Piscirickettsiaceae bacterium]|nr:DUF4136 domain-containing protein [Piscirickettsiaceae bacterium]
MINSSELMPTTEQDIVFAFGGQIFNVRLLVISAIIVLLSACTTGPTIYSDYNRTIDFNQYKSFGFVVPLDTDRQYESLISQYLKESIIVEMTRRGLTFVIQDPDVLINFHTNVEQKQKIKEIPTHNRTSYYSYRKRWYSYDAWPEYEIYIDNYEQGTLNIDVIDRQLNKMIWEGIAVKRLGEKDKLNIQSTLQEAVVEIFLQFPIAAPMEVTE